MSQPKAVIFVVFGATGDLARRMVLPAFYELSVRGLMPEKWMLVGNGRGDVSHEDFQKNAKDAVTQFGRKPSGRQWSQFASHLRFAGGGFEKSDPGSLLDVIEDTRKELGTSARFVHYLAIPPTAFMKVTEALGEHKLVTDARVVYEKPFGTSPDNFRELDRAVHRVLKEEQVFRIDHFLGKEGTQNLHALRFGNGLFDSVWNNQTIRAVQIDIPETLDIVDRAEFYEQTGALLDMVVTHLFQLAAEVAMEPPATMKPEHLQSARESVIAHFRPLDPADVVLGQFDGYTGTTGVDPHSRQNTFVAARLWIDSKRWKGVPFLLRTGKQLAVSEQRVTLLFRGPTSPTLARETPLDGNYLTVDLGGDGVIDLGLVVKKPGPDFTLAAAATTLPLDRVDKKDALPPYVRLLHDVIDGDRSLYTRPDGLAHAWEVITPILEHPPKLEKYARGSWGPSSATKLAAPDGWVIQSQPREGENPDG